jgi:hypothetical protein
MLKGRGRSSQASEPSSRQSKFDACRAVQALGFSGRVAFHRPGVPYPGLIVRDLEKAARLRVVEGESMAPAVKRWRSLEEMGGPPQSYLTSSTKLRRGRRFYGRSRVGATKSIAAVGT